MAIHGPGHVDRATFYQRAWSDVNEAAARELVDIEAGVPWDPSTMDRLAHLNRAHLALAIRMIAGMAQELGYTPTDLRWDACLPDVDDALSTVEVPRWAQSLARRTN